jgi:hypothetical protein
LTSVCVPAPIPAPSVVGTVESNIYFAELLAALECSGRKDAREHAC